MKIEFIDTDVGNNIIDDLMNSGWRITDKYPMVFDKGIDYDFYTLVLDDKTLKFEWTNWFEWEITGNEEFINKISKQYHLKVCSNLCLKK